VGSGPTPDDCAVVIVVVIVPTLAEAHNAAVPASSNKCTDARSLLQPPAEHPSVQARTNRKPHQQTLFFPVGTLPERRLPEHVPGTAGRTASRSAA
jgi:hypothetical protein